MSNLLRANFIRLLKSKTFWICTACMAGLAVYFAYNGGAKYKLYTIADSYFYCNTLIIVFEAVLIGIFIGTEYSDGAIRNKVAAGHSRARIYVSNLLTCAAAALIMYFVWMIVLFLLGGYALEKEGIRPFLTEQMPVFFLESMAAIIAQTALYLLICMLVHKKAVGVAAVIMISIVSIYIATEIEGRLREPEYYGGTLTYIDDNGEKHEEHSPDDKNPRYLEGTKRKLFETANCILPFCQLNQISGWAYYSNSMNFRESGQENPLKETNSFIVYSICVFFTVSAVGIVLFGKKNLK